MIGSSEKSCFTLRTLRRRQAPVKNGSSSYFWWQNSDRTCRTCLWTDSGRPEGGGAGKAMWQIQEMRAWSHFWCDASSLHCRLSCDSVSVFLSIHSFTVKLCEVTYTSAMLCWHHQSDVRAAACWLLVVLFVGQSVDIINHEHESWNLNVSLTLVPSLLQQRNSFYFYCWILHFVRLLKQSFTLKITNIHL